MAYHVDQSGAYAAVFITALRKYRRNYLGTLLLVTYGIHSLISFQQVLNAPFFFLVLGMCEALQREEKLDYKMITDEESIKVA